MADQANPEALVQDCQCNCKFMPGEQRAGEQDEEIASTELFIIL